MIDSYSPPSLWFALLSAWIIFGYAGASLAYARRRSAIGWALVCAFVPPFLVLLFFLRPNWIAERRMRDIVLPQKREHVVVLLHGIRTHAHWFEMVAAQIRDKLNWEVFPIRYQFYDLFSFLMPFTRWHPIERIARELDDIQRSNPKADISIIAHSFATHALVKALAKVDLDLRRIILCGGVLSTEFRRASVNNLFSNVSIVNDCGSKDYLPVLATALSWDYGPSGTWGLGTADVRDRYHDFAHSDYFKKKFVTDYWIPFLKDGTIRPTNWEQKRPATPYWLSILSKVPLRWIWLVPLLIGAFFWANHIGYKPVPGAPFLSAIVGHNVGAPEAVTEILIDNPTSQTLYFSVIGMFLIAPGGNEIALQEFGWSGDGPNGNYEQTRADRGFQIQPKNSFHLWVRSGQASQSRAELITKIDSKCDERNYLQRGIDLQTKWMPKELVDEAEKMARASFPWTEGKWTLRLTLNVGQMAQIVERSIELTELEVSSMKKNIDYYASGFGLCAVWRMHPFSNANPSFYFGFQGASEH